MIKCPKYNSIKEFLEHASFYDFGGHVTLKGITKQSRSNQES